MDAPVRSAAAHSDHGEPMHDAFLVNPAQVIGWVGSAAARRGQGILRPIPQGVTEHKILVRRG